MRVGFALIPDACMFKELDQGQLVTLLLLSLPLFPLTYLLQHFRDSGVIDFDGIPIMQRFSVCRNHFIGNARELRSQLAVEISGTFFGQNSESRVPVGCVSIKLLWNQGTADWEEGEGEGWTRWTVFNQNRNMLHCMTEIVSCSPIKFHPI